RWKRRIRLTLQKSLANDYDEFIAKLNTDGSMTNGISVWDDPIVHGVKDTGIKNGGIKTFPNAVVK
ncbi:hypothetical protein Tco_0423818, partial [Tanacetum coccineum]